MKLSLEKELNNWIDNLYNIKNLSQNSIISYKNDVLKFLDFLNFHTNKEIDKTVLQELKISDFRSFLTFRRSKNLSSNSIARNISSLKSFFNYLIKNN